MTEWIMKEDIDMDGERYIKKCKLIRCNDCNHNHETTWVDCELLPQMFGRMACENYCSLAEPKEEEDAND